MPTPLEATAPRRKKSGGVGKLGDLVSGFDPMSMLGGSPLGSLGAGGAGLGTGAGPSSARTGDSIFYPPPPPPPGRSVAAGPIAAGGNGVLILAGVGLVLAVAIARKGK